MCAFPSCVMCREEVHLTVSSVFAAIFTHAGTCCACMTSKCEISMWRNESCTRRSVDFSVAPFRNVEKGVFARIKLSRRILVALAPKPGARTMTSHLQHVLITYPL